MDDEKLIELVRSYPVLYDLSNPNYMDTELKNTLWNKIGAETKTAGPSCKARWGNIRDNFRKSLNKTKTVSGQRTKNVKLYKYSEQLSFLKKCFEERETRSNIDDDMNENVIGGLSGNVVESQENIQESAQETSNLETAESGSPIPRDSEPTASSQCFVARKKPKKQLLPNTNPPKTAAATVMEYLIAQKETMSCPPPPPPLHPVDAFLSGIAPALKKLPPHYWHYAKADIFEAVQKYEFKMLMEDQQIPVSPCSAPIYSQLPSGSSHHYSSGDERCGTTSTTKVNSQQSTSGNELQRASSTDRGQPAASLSYPLQHYFHTSQE